MVGLVSPRSHRVRAGSRIAVPVPMFHAFGFGMAVAHGDTRRHAADKTPVRRRSNACAGLVASRARARRRPGHARPDSRPFGRGAGAKPSSVAARVISAAARLDPSFGQRFMGTYGEILYSGYGSSEVGIGSFATPAELREAPKRLGGRFPAARSHPRRERQPCRAARHRAGVRGWRPDVRRLHRRRGKMWSPG